MAYNRTSAIDYARRFWNRACDDGIIWLSNEGLQVSQERKKHNAPASDGWEPMFVDDGKGREMAVFRRTVGTAIEMKTISPWEGLADCAHFLSTCLQAGGANINERGAPGMVNALQARSDTKTLAERVPQSQGQLVVDSGILKQGDMIGYFNVDPQGDYGGAKNYSHSTMYAGKLDAKDAGRVTCHTISRFPGLSFVEDRWYLHPGYTYTFMHFGSDDPPPGAGLAISLAGWWKVEYGSRTEYYYIYGDGRARYTLRAPKTNQELHAPEGTAYWFSQGNKITYIWRKTGTVEIWTPTVTDTDYQIMVNNTTSGTATKLF